VPERSMWRFAVIGAALMLAVSACAEDDGTTADDGDDGGEVTLAISSPADGTEIEGNTFALDFAVSGIQIVGADGDTSGDTGHFHVFVDRDPLAAGATIPREAGIIHTTDDPLLVTGLGVGEHTLTVVLGDGTHARIGDVEASVTVDVQGPAVEATATVADGVVTIGIEHEGFEVVAADGDASGETGHFHVLIDPETPPAPGDTISPAEEGKIIHTTESSVEIEGLSEGDHMIWVVAGDGEHTAFDPAVMAKLTVTIEAAE